MLHLSWTVVLCRRLTGGSASTVSAGICCLPFYSVTPLCDAAEGGAEELFDFVAWNIRYPGYLPPAVASPPPVYPTEGAATMSYRGPGEQESSDFPCLLAILFRDMEKHLHCAPFDYEWMDLAFLVLWKREDVQGEWC
ncbi:hypothetical protein ACOMHN_059771 [Nucella lapillus]